MGSELAKKFGMTKADILQVILDIDRIAYHYLPEKELADLRDREKILICLLDLVDDLAEFLGLPAGEIMKSCEEAIARFMKEATPAAGYI